MATLEIVAPASAACAFITGFASRPLIDALAVSVPVADAAAPRALARRAPLAAMAS